MQRKFFDGGSHNMKKTIAGRRVKFLNFTLIELLVVIAIITILPVQSF